MYKFIGWVVFILFGGIEAFQCYAFITGGRWPEKMEDRVIPLLFLLAGTYFLIFYYSCKVIISRTGISTLFFNRRSLELPWKEITEIKVVRQERNSIAIYELRTEYRSLRLRSDIRGSRELWQMIESETGKTKPSGGKARGRVNEAEL
jgi:hypothetical protein